MINNAPVLLLFAKKPEPGKVKTRLCPPLSYQQAGQVAVLLIEQSIHHFSTYWPGEIELCVWPDTDDNMLASLCRQYGIKLSTQANGDLGRKMYTAMNEKAEQGIPAMVIGTDVPHCSADVLRRAYEALSMDENVIGPTKDGGYYCIGVQQPRQEMFENVEWSTEGAYMQTLAGCTAVGIDFGCILDRLNDLDSYEDLLHVSRSIPSLRQFIDEKNN